MIRATQLIKPKYARIAWAKIDKTLERPPGIATHDWEVLLNRCNRKRKKLRTTSVSGISADQVAKAKKSTTIQVFAMV